MAPFARPITGEKAFFNRAEEFHIFRIRPRWTRGPAKNPSGLYRHEEHTVIIGVLVAASTQHFLPIGQQRHSLIFFHILNVSWPSTEKAMSNSRSTRAGKGFGLPISEWPKPEHRLFRMLLW